MSGVAGADRILRQDVEPTVKDFINRVLNNFDNFQQVQTSGSYNTSAKQDFGDIDLIVHIEGNDKKIVKKQLQDYLESLPSNIILPFTGKYEGKRTYNAGELISCRYPQYANPGKSVQIDCIIALTAEESGFKKTFLDFNAQVQGLTLGLVKVAYQEALTTNTEADLLSLFNIDVSTISMNAQTKFEFNLSGQKLEFRSYEQNAQGQEIKGTRNIHWVSTKWNDVTRLLANYNLNKGFESLLTQIDKTVKSPTSKTRIKGIFNSMVSVKSGEIGTPKAKAKEDAIKLVNDVLESQEVNFLQYISESKLYRIGQTQRYDWKYLSNITFANILTLHILRHIDVTEDFAKNYCKKTYQMNSFHNPNNMFTDLYMNLHGLTGRNRKSKNFSDSVLNKKADINYTLLIRYLKKLEAGIDVNDSRRDLFRLQKEIKPDDLILHSLRRLTQEWPLLDRNQKKLVFTRLYFYLKNNARLIDIMEPFLLAMQSNNMLIPDAEDK